MDNRMIFINNADSLVELENKLSGESLLISDETQNKFCYIEMDGDIKCGIAYYDYGVKPGFVTDQDNTVLWVGFGKKIICIDVFNKEVLFEEELFSIFYEIISDTLKRYICAVCELDIYCFHSFKIAWKMGFKDIINKCEMNNDREVNIEYGNGEELILMINNGKVIG